MRRTRPMGFKRLVTVLLTLLFFSLPGSPLLFAEQITFSGGYTKVNMQQGSKSILLSGGATVQTGSLTLSSDSIELYGKDYSFVSCTGNVKAVDHEHGISFSSPNLFHDRTAGTVTTDSWIEIQDTQNQAALSGAWFMYSMEHRQIKLQMMAKVIKVTDEGLMVCRADSIEYDGKNNTVMLKGNATVSWNSDNYSAAMIMVDLDTNDITLHGAISGEFNG